MTCALGLCSAMFWRTVLMPSGSAVSTLLMMSTCGAAEVDFAGIVGQLVSGAMRIEHHDVEIGTIERSVVVAAVPQDDVAFLLRLAQDFLVIHSGIDRACPR